MRLNRRQLRRLVESAIYEQAEGNKEIKPSEVRHLLSTEFRYSGMTAHAIDVDGNKGLAICFSPRFARPMSSSDSKKHEENIKVAAERLKKVYGEDRVTFDATISRLQGGSTTIKNFHGRKEPRTGRASGGVGNSHGQRDSYESEFKNKPKYGPLVFMKMD